MNVSATIAAAPARASARSRAAAVLQTSVMLLWPALVAVGGKVLAPRALAACLLGGLALAAVTGRIGLGRAAPRLAVAGVVAAAAVVLDDDRLLLAWPTLLSAVFLVEFAASLRGGWTFVERIARATVPDLSGAEVEYCRTVTVVWIGFFVLNGAIAAALAVVAPRALWAAYAGGVAYVLMGALFVGEYVIRKRRFGRFGPGLVDRLLARALGRGAAAG
jgi:uncharacterized membrane protein